MKDSIFSWHRILALCILLIQVTMVVPAQELYLGRQLGNRYLEQYLDRADMESSQQRWQELADQGMLVALAAWESSQTYLLEQDPQRWQTERDSLERELAEEREVRLAQWLLDKYIQSQSNPKFQQLATELEQRATQWQFQQTDEAGSQVATRQVDAADSQEAKAQWLNSNQQLIQQYLDENALSTSLLVGQLQELNLDEATGEALAQQAASSYQAYLAAEYDLILRSETMDLLGNLLYDRESLRAASAQESADNIALTLIQEAKSSTEIAVQELFQDFQEDVAENQLEEGQILVAGDQWAQEFQRQLEEGLAVWDKVEVEFLSHRSQWEQEALETYEAGEEAWLEAFQKLQTARQEWENEIMEEFQRGMEEWSQSQLEQEFEIQAAQEELVLSLQEEIQRKEELAVITANVYNQMRSLLVSCYKGVENWYSNWAQKYNKVYSYWKTEDTEGYDNRFSQGTIEGLNEVLDTYSSDGNVINLEYLSSSNTRNKIQVQVNQWKEAYLEQIKNEAEQKILQLESEIAENEAILQNIENKQNNVDANESSISTSSHDDAETEKQNIQEQNLVLATERDDLQELLIQIEQLDISLSGEKIASQLQNNSGFELLEFDFEEDLWDSSTILLEQNTGWLVLAEAGFENLTTASNNFLEAVDPTSLEGSTSDLNAEIQRLENTLSYWQDELAVAQALKEYAITTSSSAETAQETQKKLTESQQGFQQASESYENHQQLVQAAHQSIYQSMEALSEIQLELDAIDNRVTELNNRMLALTEVEKDLDREVMEAQFIQALDNLGKTLQSDEYTKLVDSFFLSTLNQGNYVYTNAIEELVRLIPRQFTHLDEAGLEAEIQSYTEVIAELYEIINVQNKTQEDATAPASEPLGAPASEENLEGDSLTSSSEELVKTEIVISEKSQEILEILEIGSTRMDLKEIVSHLESIVAEYQNELLYRQEAQAYLTTGKVAAWEKQELSSAEETRRQLIQESFADFQVGVLNEKHNQGIQELKEIFKNYNIWNLGSWDSALGVLEQLHSAGSNLHGSSVSAIEQLSYLLVQHWCLQNQKSEDKAISTESLISEENEISQNQIQQEIATLQTMESSLLEIQELLVFMNSNQFSLWEEESKKILINHTVEQILSKTNSLENLPVTDGGNFFLQLGDEYPWKKDFFQLPQELQQALIDGIQEIGEIEVTNKNLHLVQSILKTKKADLEKALFLVKLEQFKNAYYQDTTWLDLAAVLKNCTQIDGSTILAPEDWAGVQQLLSEDGLYSLKSTQLQNLGAQWIALITNQDTVPYKILSSDEVTQNQENSSQYLESISSLLDSSSLEKELIQLGEIYQLLESDKQEIMKEKEELDDLAKQIESERKEKVSQYQLTSEELNEALEAYKVQVVEEDALYQSLLQSRLDLRIAEEKYQWATRIYLESIGSEESQEEIQYESPMQRYNQMLLVTNRYQKALDILVQMKNLQQLQHQDYLAEVESYEAALENVYLMEVILSQTLTAVAKQEDATREAELKDDINAAQLFADYDSLFSSIINADKQGIHSPALELIRIKRREDGSYDISLGYETNYVKVETRSYTDSDGNEVSYDLYDYVTSVKQDTGSLNKEVLQAYLCNPTETIIRVDDDLKFTEGEVEVRQWLERIYAKGDDYLNQLLLASIHLKTYATSIQDALGGQADIRQENLFQADQLPSLSSFHGINVSSSYTSERKDVIADAYNFILAQEGGQEDLAGYILYRETNLLDKNSWQERELNLIEYLALDNVTDELSDKREQKQIEAAVAFSSAAALAVAAFFQPWLLVAAGAATAVGIAATDAAISIGEAEDGVYDLMQGNKENALAEITRINDLLENLAEGKQNLQDQWELLNFLYYGDVSQNSSEQMKTESLSSQAILGVLKEMLDESSLVSNQEYQNLLSSQFLDALLVTLSTDGKEGVTVVAILQEALVQFQEDFGQATENLTQVAVDIQGQAQTAMTGFYQVLGQSMEISQEDKEQLALLEAQSIDESLSSTQRQLAMAEYESLYQSLHAMDNSFVTQLENLALSAYGSEGWNNLLHKKNIYNKMKSLYNTRIDLTSSTEEYTAWLQSLMTQQAGASWADSSQQVLSQAQHQWQLELELINRRQSLWEGEVMATLAAGEKSWQRVEEKLNKEYNLWRRNFQQELEERQSEWDVNYLDFLQKKEAWIQESHRQGVVQGLGQELVSDRGIDSGAELITAINQDELEAQLANLGRNMESSVSQEMTEAIVESLLADSYLDQLMNRSMVMAGLGSNAGAGVKKVRRTTFSLESHLEAQKQVAKTSQLMKDAAGRQATDYGQNLLERILASYMEGIDRQNQSMVDWQERLARDAGYTVDGSIRRTIVVDATLMNPIKETQYLPLYQHFSVVAPELRRLEVTSSENAMFQLGRAQAELTLWGQSIIGANGLLSEHMGVAPELVGNPELAGSKKAAFQDMGSGQMGTILVDYHWNSIQARKGMEELSKAGHDKRLFDDRGLPFSAPTLREVTEVAMSMAGSIPGYGWLNYIDDAIFAGIDLGGGYKTAGEIGRELAIKAVGAAIGAGTNWAGNAISDIKNTAGKIAAMSGLNLASGSLTNVATVTLQSMNFDEIGTGDFFNGEMFTSMIRDKNSWASIVAGAASAGVSMYGSNFFGAMGAEANKFYGGAMNLATSVASQAASYGVYAAFHGGDWAEAYNAMGGINVNVASFGALADFVGSSIARNNSTGQNILGKVIDKLDGKGIMLNLGLDGVSTKIGSGGIDLSGNLYDLGKRAIDKRALESYAQSHGKEEAETVWKNYVYGDWTQENTSARLASGLDQLEFVEQGDFTALTTSNGAGGRLIQMLDSGNSYNNAITLGHESYRNGLVGTAEQQAAETLAATTGHTQMALRILDDGKKDQIQMTENLAMDITAYKLSQGLGNEAIFADYVAGNYDASGDYWKLMDDGTLVNDGSGWLVDEHGRAIKNKDGKQIGAKNIEAGLLNILFGGTNGKMYNEFSVMEKVISFSILEDSGIGKSYPDGKYGMSNAQWDKNDRRALNMDYVMEYAGKTIATQVFAQYYDSTVDSIIAGSNGVHLGVNVKDVPVAAQNRFNDLYQAKSSFYESAGSFFVSDDVRVSGEYGVYITDKDGNILPDYKEYYKTYNNLHFGIDLVIDSGKDDILLGFSGKVYSNAYNEAEGYTVQMKYGYNFEDSFMDLGIYGEYGHLKEKSHLINNQFYSGKEKVGLFGNTGTKTTGAHLHYSIYTQDNVSFSDTTMKLLLGLDYSKDSMYNGSWRTVYNPSKLFEIYRD